jgi:hypothetical protein
MSNAPVQVHFRDLARALTQELQTLRHKYGTHAGVAGCVAWVTHPGIIHELSQVRSCALVMNQESDLPFDRTRLDAGRFPFSGAPFTGRPDSVRWTRGESGRGYMHNKFLVLGVFRVDGWFVPQRVWTGSFNFTRNAEKSHENALVLTGEDIARGYYAEFCRIYASASATYAEPSLHDVIVDESLAPESRDDLTMLTREGLLQAGYELCLDLGSTWPMRGLRAAIRSLRVVEEWAPVAEHLINSGYLDLDACALASCG